MDRLFNAQYNRQRRKLHHIPLSIAIGVGLLAIFFMYQTNTLKGVPCQNNIAYNAARDFIHVDYYHIILNLVAFWYVASIEQQIGTPTYAVLIGSIVALSAVMTYFSMRFFNTKCSIGFSGVILGLMAYGLLSSEEKFNWQILAYIVLVSISPVAGVHNISVSGHLIGALAGVISYFIFKAIRK